MLQKLARKRVLAAVLIPLLTLFVYVSVRSPSSVINVPEPVAFDLEDVLERDTLIVLTPYTATGYFVYRGLPLGFEYELLKEFADQNDIALQMRVINDRDSLLYYLNAGAGDIVAGRRIPTPEDSTQALVSLPLYETEVAVVQRSGPPQFPDSVDSTLAQIERETGEDLELNDSTGLEAQTRPELPDSISLAARRISSPAELAGEVVHVPGQSALAMQVLELQDRISGDIEVVEVGGDVALESLILGVSAAEIDFTVTPEALGRLKESEFENIAVRPSFGEEVPIVFLARENAPQLHEALNTFLEENPGLRRNLYRKYYVDRRGYRERVQSTYLTSLTGVLSPYDDLVKSAADEIGWDWRLLASQMYQESRFNPTARSWAGAMGLLQLMPGTAREVGVADPYDPEQNVQGAVRYLRWLEETYWNEAIPDSTERVKFILASYNAGAGHVMDAQRLTEYYDGDPTNWEDVAYWLLQKSKRPVFTHPVVRHGYARGLEPVTYVSLILSRYDHYRQFVREEEPAEAETASQRSAPPGSTS